MAIDFRGRALLTVAALIAGIPAAFAAPPALAPEVEREVLGPEGASFQPSPSDEEGAVDRFAQYTLALEKRDFAAAYAMLRLSFQASNPRLEWEMNHRKRAALWADGKWISIGSIEPQFYAILREKAGLRTASGTRRWIAASGPT